MSGASINRRVSVVVEHSGGMRRLLFMPTSRIIEWWSWLMCALDLYWLMASPYRWAFNDFGAKGVAWDYMVDAIYVVDFALPFFVAIIVRGELITSHRTIARHYLRRPTGFALNLLAGPVVALCNWAAGPATPWVAYFRMLRCARVNDIHLVFAALEIDVNVSYMLARLARFLVVVLVEVHIVACVWFYVGRMGHAQGAASWLTATDAGFPDADLGVQYLRSLYFSTVVVATLGFGDLHPVNEAEGLFLSFVNVITMFVAFYVGANISALAVLSEQVTAEFRFKMANLSSAMEQNQFPAILRRRLFDYFQLMHDKAALGTSLLETLPRTLKMEVTDHLNRDLMEKNPLLTGCEPRFVSALAVVMRPQFFTPGQYIVHEDDASREMYLVSVGRVELSCSFLPASGVGRGELFGDLAFLYNIKQTHSAKALTHCTVYALSREHWDELARNFITEAEKVRVNALRSTEESVRGSKKFKMIEQSIRRQTEEKLMRMCYFAGMNDVEKMEEMIVQGLSVDAADYDGRTPIHVAASEGHLRAVEFLVSRGANINASDRWKGTPLADAVRQGHESLALWIAEHGGRISADNAASELCSAASLGDAKRLSLLVRCGMDVNAADYDRRTALHLAASEGRSAAVEDLLALGADVNRTDRWRGTALDDAVRHGHVEVARLLRSRGGMTGEEAAACGAGGDEDELHVPEEALAALEEVLRHAPGVAGPRQAARADDARRRSTAATPREAPPAAGSASEAEGAGGKGHVVPGAVEPSPPPVLWVGPGPLPAPPAPAATRPERPAAGELPRSGSALCGPRPDSPRRAAHGRRSGVRNRRRAGGGAAGGGDVAGRIEALHATVEQLLKGQEALHGIVRSLTPAPLESSSPRPSPGTPDGHSGKQS